MTQYLPAPEPVSPFRTSFDDADVGEDDRNASVMSLPSQVEPSAAANLRHSSSYTTSYSPSWPAANSARSAASPEVGLGMPPTPVSAPVGGSVTTTSATGSSQPPGSASMSHFSHMRAPLSSSSSSQSFGSATGGHSGPPSGGLNSNVRSWSNGDIRAWLDSLGCADYYHRFLDNHMTGEVLLESDIATLKQLGIRKVGDRIRIHQSLKRLRAQEAHAVKTTHLHTLERLNELSVSPFANAGSPLAFPVDGYFSRGVGGSGTNGTPGPRGPKSGPKTPQPLGSNGQPSGQSASHQLNGGSTTQTVKLPSYGNTNVYEIFSMEVVKQNNVKFVYPQGQSRTVNIAGCRDADDIKRRAIQKLLIDESASPPSTMSTLPSSNPADWCTYVVASDDEGKLHLLGDQELFRISQSPESPERRRLLLCSLGSEPTYEQLAKSNQIQARSHLRLSSSSTPFSSPGKADSVISDTALPTARPNASRLSLAQSLRVSSYTASGDKSDGEESSVSVVPRQRKPAERLSSQRPPSELISSNLAHYFPSAPSNDLQQTIRNSQRVSRRMSRMSARMSHRMSTSSSVWGVPEDEEAPPVPDLLDALDASSLTGSDLKLPNDGTIQGNKGSSILESVRRSIVPSKRQSSHESISGVLSALSNLSVRSATRTLSSIATISGSSSEVSAVEPEEEPDVEDDTVDDTEFLETVRREESCPTKWIKGRLIGSGSFGTVYLGMNSFTGELMAVKQVELPSEDRDKGGYRKRAMVDALQREMNLLRDLHHENIVQYLGSNSEDNFLNIFLEYVPGGSVALLLGNYGVFEEPLIRNFVRQILHGLEYLHDQSIIHRDIKGANILVDNKANVKISDFGISKKIEAKLLTNNRASLQGSVFWMAPEVVKQTSYTLKADIWSLGCLIVEMFSGTHPFPEFTQMQAIFRLGNSIPPPSPEDCSEDAKDFLAQTFNIDHEKRPTSSELLRHKFITTTLDGSQMA